MSTSSTTLNNYECKIQNCASRENTTRNKNCVEPFRTSEETVRFIPVKKRSNDKVLDELSTFIDEFSYLTDGQDSKPGAPKSRNRPYNVCIENSCKNDERLFNKHVDTRPYRNNYNRRRKSVEWVDQIRPNTDNRIRNVEYYRDTPIETSDEGRMFNLRESTDSDHVFERFNRSPINTIKIEDENRYWRSRSRLKRRKYGYDDNKKLIRYRVESSERYRKIPLKKVRIKQSKPLVRYWPFRYEKKKMKYRIAKYPLVRKENCIPFERKVEISSDTPTVITLYPKNVRGKLSLVEIDELEFLADPDLPCKCFKCMKKYEILQQISNDEPNIVYYEPKNENQPLSMGDDDNAPQSITLVKQPKKCACKTTRRSSHNVEPAKNTNQMENNLICPQGFEHRSANKSNFCCNTTKQRYFTNCFKNFWGCPQNYSIPSADQPCFYKQIGEDCCGPCQRYEPYSNLRHHKLKSCSYPCDNEHSMTDCSVNDEQNGEACYKSVYFRFDCVGHQIHPVVTQYFHSILNNTMH